MQRSVAAPSSVRDVRRTSSVPPGRGAPAPWVWAVGYCLICLTPVLQLVFAGPSRRPLLVEAAIRVGYVGLIMLVLEFALVSRLRWLAAPLGIDVLYRWHRHLALVAMGLILAHPALLLASNFERTLRLFNLTTAPWHARFAVPAVGLLLALVLASVWRRRLRLPYYVWQVTHSVAALGVVGLALAHVVAVSDLGRSLSGKFAIAALTAGVVGPLLWTHLVSPLVRLHRPWRVFEAMSERGQAITLVLEPVGHEGVAFSPGQFGWLSFHATPFWLGQHHPVSFSSPSEPGRNRVGLTVKAAGDWAGLAATLRPGARVYLDGPYGAFSIDLVPAPGYVFLAAGIGITPIYSMLATMCVREDSRPVLLLYANRDWDHVTFRDQLEELSGYMPNLEVVHLLSRPDDAWCGERGHIRADVVNRHLPGGSEGYHCFVCGSERFADRAVRALQEVGIPRPSIHRERFVLG